MVSSSGFIGVELQGISKADALMTDMSTVDRQALRICNNTCSNKSDISDPTQG